MVRVTISELEETIDVMVKSNGGANKLVKPSWWPAGCQFPLIRRPGIQNSNWRETLCYIISKCNQYKTKRLRQKPMRIQCGGTSSSSRKRRNRKLKRKNVVKSATMGNGRLRRDSTGSSHGSTVSSIFGGTATPLARQPTIVNASSTIVCSGGGSGTRCSEVSAATVLAKNFGLSIKMPTPFVQVYDVCKVNPSININNNYIKIEKNDDCDDIKRDIKLEKSDFMNYFGLNMTKSESVPSSQQTISQIKGNKNNIINCPHIPFSSNVGRKLMQGWHTYDTDVVEKRLERLERYLCNNDLPSLLTPIKDNFEVSNKSKTQFSHFYVFPTKKRHRKGKLTPRSRFLLTKYCKPCLVNLSKSEQDIENYLSRKNQNIIAFIDLTNTDDSPQQKENKTPPFTLLESRVVLTTIDDDKFKENSLTSSLVKKSARTTLQTLTPRNENLTEPKTATGTTATNKKFANFINPSVVLQPIHELFDFSKRDKILNQTYKIARTPYNKVVKSRVNVYNPRRCSTRLINV